MSDHGEPRFDIHMRCMCAPFSTTRSQTCTSGFKVSVTVLQLGNRPYITHISTHIYKVIFHRHLGTLLLFTHTAISIHEHNHITTQTPQVYVSVRTYLMSSLSFLFSLPLFLTMSLTIFFKTKAALHLAFTPFPDEAAALSLSSLSPFFTSAYVRSFYFVPDTSSAVWHRLDMLTLSVSNLLEGSCRSRLFAHPEPEDRFSITVMGKKPLLAPSTASPRRFLPLSVAAKSSSELTYSSQSSKPYYTR